MNALFEEIKQQADKYCRDNAKTIEPSQFQTHIENAMRIGASMVLKQQQKASLDALCGMGPASIEEKE